MNHSVLVVGYDLSGNIPYLEIKNSWGKNWGENGYYRISLGSNLTKNGKGHCNMFSHPFNVVPTRK